MTMSEDVGLKSAERMASDVTAELRVSNGTPVKTLATAILRYLDDRKRVKLSCIGPQSLSQAIKAIAIANGEAASGGYLLALIPSFETKHFADRQDAEKQVEMTALNLVVGRVPITV